ncbi:MAG: TonB-dependent receptor, partial [Rhizobiales bacterium]|nr:TonB-dependent receptor [Hyphomicrobiales bacterium]
KAALFGLDNQLFDMERVEVLRGPQGTLFGRNATGGVIQYVAAKPSSDFTGYAEIAGGEYGLFRAEGAVGGQLTDGVQARISYLHKQTSGYNTNLFAGRPNGNDMNVEAVRAQLRLEPSPNFSADLFFQYAENRSDGNMFTHISVVLDPATGLAVENPGGTDSTGYKDPTPNDPWDVNVDAATYLITKQYTGIGRLNWKISDEITLTSITGYEASHKDMLVDSDATPKFVRESQFHPDAEEFSQEIRIAGDHGAFRWLAGGYYFHYDVAGTQASRGTSYVSSNYKPMDYAVSTESYALFGNLSVDVAPTVSVEGGLRYTHDKKTLDFYIPFTFIFGRFRIVRVLGGDRG